MTDKELFRIEQYLDEAMNPDQRQEFESEIQQNAELREKLDQVKTTRLFLQYESLQKEKILIQKASQRYHQSNRWMYGLGILLIVLVVATVYFIQPKKEIANPTSIQKTIITQNSNSNKQTSIGNNFSNTSTIASPKNETIFSTDKEPKISNQIEQDQTTQLSNTTNVTNTTNTNAAKNITVKRDSINCTSLDFNFTVQPTCQDKSQGIITVTKVKGGTMPYRYSINSGNKSIQNEFFYLAEGEHVVQVWDANQCFSSKTISVSSTSCTIESNGIISLSQQRPWVFPKNISSGAILITKTSGEMVYTANITDGDPSSWAGIDLNGNMVAPAVYLYTLTENGNIIAKGNITVVP